MWKGVGGVKEKAAGAMEFKRGYLMWEERNVLSQVFGDFGIITVQDLPVADYERAVES